MSLTKKQIVIDVHHISYKYNNNNNFLVKYLFYLSQMHNHHVRKSKMASKSAINDFNRLTAESMIVQNQPF